MRMRWVILLAGACLLMGGTEAPKPRRGQNHWAFRPRSRPQQPAVKQRGWVRNPIDAFILARLEQQGFAPAQPAGPRQLLRRVRLNLTGLPPTLAEQEAFLRDPSPRALERVVDSLLARPAYAERWARHWLDLVRFAETNGYERDATKPAAWKYRDYVIRAFHQDKPFDRFLLEQLAGDELADVSPETLVATGYYRLGPWDDEPADPATDRFDQLDDIVSTTSQVFLGLTLGCARCHDHKFEPLSTEDYYGMVAVFNGLERPRNGRTELALPLGNRAELDALARRDAAIEPLASEIRALEVELAKAQDSALCERVAALEAEIAALKSKTPDLPPGYFLHEPKPPAPTHVLIRGQPGRLGPEVAPAVPAIAVTEQPAFPAPDRTSLRRLALARWLSSPDNPLTARVIVNRVWQHHFGEGLVRTPSDFGVMGQKPTHPELLDWLANWFVEQGWSFKKLHRLILSSNSYRMSSRGRPEYAARDAANLLLWRFPYKRLEVEAIRDSMLAVSGRLNPKMFGPSVLPAVPPAALEGSSDPDKIWKPHNEDEASRRTIYVFLKRSMIVPLLELLDLCDTARTSAQRLTTSVAPQALALFNGDFANRQAQYFARRLLLEVGAEPARQIDRAWRLALARPPTVTERAHMLDFLEREAERLETRERLDPENSRLRALEQMCRVIFNLNEFVYPD
ncbi:MAG: DUF1553 domain-containing protein [Acidobacteria bacterium]|nr:DUF1553 domain-containing protein [Acidobacteriota bacterium]